MPSRGPLKRTRAEPPVCEGFIIDLSILSFRNVCGPGDSRATAPRSRHRCSLQNVGQLPAHRFAGSAGFYCAAATVICAALSNSLLHPISALLHLVAAAPRHDRHRRCGVLRRALDQLVGIDHVDQHIALGVAASHDLHLLEEQRAALAKHILALGKPLRPPFSGTVK